MKSCYVFIPSESSGDDTGVYTALEALNTRIKHALNGLELAESSRVAMNRMVEGANTHIAYLYSAHSGRLVGTVRVAEAH